MIRTTFTAAICVSLLSIASFADHCPLGGCTGDLNGDRAVDLADLSDLLENFGCCVGDGCYDANADLDASGCVDLPDLSALLSNFGGGCPLFEYPPPATNDEAEQIALEMLGPGGGLFADAAVIARVAQDLDAIRAFEASLANQFHSPEWAAEDLLVAVDPGLPHDDFLCLNEYYQAVITGEIPSLHLYVLQFPRALNPEAMALIYAAAPEVEYAEPNGFIGGENYWRPTVRAGGVWEWSIDDGFMDCFDGCDCHRAWVFQTTAAGEVTLISFDYYGQPWCP
ncbi:MAG: hypothetical protein HRF50_05420 [Phycisphaerae bacterium]|jgi:hypothetical protein